MFLSKLGLPPSTDKLMFRWEQRVRPLPGVGRRPLRQEASLVCVHICGHRSHSARKFFSSDTQQLTTHWNDYVKNYQRFEVKGDALFLGTVFPGKTCLKHLLRAFHAQDMMRHAMPATSTGCARACAPVAETAHR